MLPGKVKIKITLIIFYIKEAFRGYLKYDVEGPKMCVLDLSCD